MISAILKGIRQLDDKGTRKYVWLSILTAIVVFVVLWVGIGVLITQTALFEIPWLETVIDVLGGLATLALTWFMFPAALSAVVGLFLEHVVARVEVVNYPQLAKAREPSVWEMTKTGARFLGLMVALNLGILLFLFVPPLFPFVFYGVNGYLLGREYYEMVALRRLSPEQASALRKANAGRLFVTGVLIALALTIPVLNLIIPVVAVAAITHLFHAWRGEHPA
jgi:CysZ protein